MFIIALFRIAKNWKQFKYLSTEKWINKLRYTDTIEYYSSKGTNYHTCNICEIQKLCWAKEAKPKTTYCMTWLIWSSGTGKTKSYGDKKKKTVVA